MRTFIASLVVLAFASPHPVLAQSSNGVAVVAQLATQTNHQLVPDGEGGAFIVWQDSRTGAWDIYAQRIDGSGNPSWGLAGVEVSAAAGDQTIPQLVSDGQGGIIVCWMDTRLGSNDIFAQRLNARGVTQWSFGGVALTTATSTQDRPRIASDGANGAVVVWQDFRFGNWDLFAQRISGAGAVQWTVDGVAVATVANQQENPVVVSDGAGGVIMSWQDLRSSNYDIYAQRLSASGVAQWTSNGIPVSAVSGHQLDVAIAADDVGGAFLAWEDQRAGTQRIYAQRLGPTGIQLWTTDGVAVATPPAATNDPQLASDGTGGVIVTWYDNRGITSNDIYAQRVASTGVPQWVANGVSVCTSIGEQFTPKVVSDGAGGGIITWHDSRFGNYDIFAQRVLASGARLWAVDGLPLCRTVGTQDGPNLVTDGSGGAIVTWTENRFSATTGVDLFAQRVAPDGTTLFPDAEYPSLISVEDVPNDQGGAMKLSWLANIHDLPPFNRIGTYRIWRSVPSHAVATRTGRMVPMAQAGEAGPNDLLVTHVAGTDYFWEFLADRPSGHIYRYSYVAATTSDSMPGSNPVTAFMVQALHSTDTNQWWYSNPDSGYSVDNLGPQQPAALTAQYSGSTTTLRWLPNLETDFAVYRVYRGTSDDFVIGPGTLVASQPDTGYVDPAGGAFHYKVTAVDLHGNESPVALARPPGAVSVDHALATAEIGLSASPNPVRMSTVVRVRGKADARATLEVIDLGGRRVRTLLDGAIPQGEFAVTWDGHDEAGAEARNGVYFLRLSLGAERTSRRIVVAR
jgi:hypothetical protein